MVPSKALMPEIVGQDIPLSDEVSELPNTFQDAVTRASKRSLDCIAAGQMRVRIDFDTTVGDMTYTSLKSTIPMLKDLTAVVAREMDLTMTVDVPTAADSSDSEAGSEAGAVAEEPLRTLRIFFPDMGAAALARRDWKMGTDVAEVPPCVRTANMQNDVLDPTDKVAVVLCPQSSEVDYVRRIMEMCEVSSVPIIMINPNLVNMDQGYGVRECKP